MSQDGEHAVPIRVVAILEPQPLILTYMGKKSCNARKCRGLHCQHVVERIFSSIPIGVGGRPSGVISRVLVRPPVRHRACYSERSDIGSYGFAVRDGVDYRPLTLGDARRVWGDSSIAGSSASTWSTIPMPPVS